MSVRSASPRGGEGTGASTDRSPSGSKGPASTSRSSRAISCSREWVSRTNPPASLVSFPSRTPISCWTAARSASASVVSARACQAVNPASASSRLARASRALPCRSSSSASVATPAAAITPRTAAVSRSQSSVAFFSRSESQRERRPASSADSARPIQRSPSNADHPVAGMAASASARMSVNRPASSATAPTPRPARKPGWWSSDREPTPTAPSCASRSPATFGQRVVAPGSGPGAGGQPGDRVAQGGEGRLRGCEGGHAGLGRADPLPHLLPGLEHLLQLEEPGLRGVHLRLDLLGRPRVLELRPGGLELRPGLGRIGGGPADRRSRDDRRPPRRAPAARGSRPRRRRGPRRSAPATALPRRGAPRRCAPGPGAPTRRCASRDRSAAAGSRRPGPAPPAR